VRDQGPGIPIALRERVFERFAQGAGSSGSLGLGLHVAHELVKLHAGRILIEDVAPHGAALIVELPRSDPATHQRPG
jgi:signal transduction histidine kinase